MFTVKSRCDRIRKYKENQVHHCGQDYHGNHGVSQKLTDAVCLFPAVGMADKRLDSLGDSGIERKNHEGNIGDDSVGSHSGIAFQVQNQHVKYNHDNRSADLGQQGRKSEGNVGTDGICIRNQFPEMESSFLSKPVRGHDSESDNRRKSGGKNRTKHSHIAREDKNIVKYDIEQTSAYGCNHGKSWIAVVSYETENDIIKNKGR